MAGPRITLIRPPILSDPKSGMRRSGMRGINAIRITGRLLNKSIPIGADIASVSVMTRIFIISTIAARGKVGIKDSMASVRRRPPAPTCVPVSPLVPGVHPGQPTGPSPSGQPPVLRPSGSAHRSRSPSGSARRSERASGSAHRPRCPSGQPTGPSVVRLSLPVRVRPAQPTGPGASGSAHRSRVCVRLSPPVPESVRLSPPVQRASGSCPWSQLAQKPLPLASVNLKKLLGVRKNRSRSSPAGARSQIAPPGRSGIILHMLYCVKEIKVSPV